MLMMGWLYIIVIGILAGFLAGQIMRGKGFGLVVDLLLGIVGAFVGAQIFGLLGIAAWGLPGQLIMSVVGALLILFVVRLIKKG
jgi:uncharacterized membrane protein YeaQ/YmgE (transglycosylase-associated protein family)